MYNQFKFPPKLSGYFISRVIHSTSNRSGRQKTGFIDKDHSW